MEMYSSTRMWINNGYSPNEISSVWKNPNANFIAKTNKTEKSRSTEIMPEEFDGVYALLDDMRDALPLYAYPTAELVKELVQIDAGLRKLTVNSRLEITQLHYGGNEAGIMCAAEMNGQVLLPSLTHLEFKDRGDLYDRINAYKKRRISNLQSEHIAGYIKSNRLGRNELCLCGSGKKYKKCCGR